MDKDRGRVVLVGAGLLKEHLTLEGLKWLGRAEVIVYDALIDEAVLGYAAPGCELIYAGKRAGRHSMAQDEINALLLDKAREGKLVVRLKGGDGFVFGRGGEELEYLGRHGTDCRIVPGISSAVAVPEVFGIPVTHRGAASAFCVVTAHEAKENRIDYAHLAAFGGTLVFLMGGSGIAGIAAALTENGMSPDTPAAVLSKGFCSDCMDIRASVGEFSHYGQEVKTPAVFVVGAVAAMELPKAAGAADMAVTITGTRGFIEKVADEFDRYNIRAGRVETLRVRSEAGNIPDDVGVYSWIVFTSSNGVDIFFRELSGRGRDIRELMSLKFACVGEGTAESLSKHGFLADLIPKDHCVRALGSALSDVLTENDSVLILRSRRGSTELCDMLKSRVKVCDDIRIYDTERMQTQLPHDGYVIFGSAEGVRAYFERRGEEGSASYVCIGKETAAALKGYIGSGFIVSESQDAQGIVRAVMEDMKSGDD